MDQKEAKRAAPPPLATIVPMSLQPAIPSRVALQQSPCPLRRSFTASLSTLLLYSHRQRIVNCPQFRCLNRGVHSSLSQFEQAMARPGLTIAESQRRQSLFAYTFIYSQPTVDGSFGPPPSPANRWSTELSSNKFSTAPFAWARRTCGHSRPPRAPGATLDRDGDRRWRG